MSQFEQDIYTEKTRRIIFKQSEDVTLDYFVNANLDAGEVYIEDFAHRITVIPFKVLPALVLTLTEAYSEYVESKMPKAPTASEGEING